MEFGLTYIVIDACGIARSSPRPQPTSSASSRPVSRRVAFHGWKASLWLHGCRVFRACIAVATRTPTPARRALITCMLASVARQLEALGAE